VTLPFWFSDVCLVTVQAATVALPARRRIGVLARMRSRLWGLVPLAAIVATVFGIRAASGSANGLTYLALVAVPPLAAVALGWCARRADPRLALLAVPLFALAWADRSGLAGEAAGVILTALSCVTLGVLLVQVAPLGWLKLGIVLMSVADTVLVIAQLLQPANDVLNAAAPGLGLPQLQRELFGSAVMGYGDLFVAGVFGAIVAAERGRQGAAARLTLLLAFGFDLLFFAVDLLPATVPVALALVLREIGVRRRRTSAPERQRARRRGLVELELGGGHHAGEHHVLADHEQ
jgi:hypothetical protein